MLHRLSPLVEPLSLDEAFVDLRAATTAVDFSHAGLELLIGQLKDEVRATTNGLTASVGVATSKFVAKVASELAKPDGSAIVEAGRELELLRPLKVAVIPGVGPVTQEKLHRIGIHTVSDLQGCAFDELAQVIGKTHAQALLDWRTPVTTGPLSLIGRRSRSRSRTPSKPIWSLGRSSTRSCSVTPARWRAGCAPPGCSPTRCRSRFGCMTSRPLQDHARYSARRIAQMSSARSPLAAVGGRRTGGSGSSASESPA